MTKCKECGAEISTKAESCPQCGAKRKKTSGCALVLLAFLLFFLFVALASQCSPTTTTSSSPTKSEPAKTSDSSAESAADEETREMVWVEKGKDAVREKLKDSDSAKFQNVYFHRGVNNVPLSCGEVNSKNSFGAYGGFQRFISGGQSDLTFLEEQMDRSEFVKVWNQMCVKKNKS